MKLPKLLAIAGVLLFLSAHSHAAKLTCENGYYAEVEGGKLISITIPSGDTFKGNRYWSYNSREKTVVHSLLNQPHKCSNGYKPPTREEQIKNTLKSLGFAENHRLYYLSKKEGKQMEAFARKQMKSNPICYRVSDGAKSKQKKGSFYFYCEDEAGKLEQIFFTASDMKSSQVLAATTHVPRSRAISLCDTAIKGQLTNSGTFDSHMLDTSVSQMANGVSGVVRGFSAKNGLGMEVDYRATCHVNSIGEVSVSLEQK